VSIGGDTIQRGPTLSRKTDKRYLLLEFSTLYLGLPFAMWYGLSAMHLLIIPALLIASLLCLGLLWHDPGFDRRRFWKTEVARVEIGRCILLFVPCAVLMTALVWYKNPSELFDLPRHHHVIWIMIMLFYPFVSVPPQEIIYRKFLFHRYEPILPSPESRILVSALTFSLAHVIFGNVLALAITLCGGLLFAFTYHRTKSLLAVSVEHAVYGSFVFTVGLGSSLLYGTKLMIERLTGAG